MVVNIDVYEHFKNALNVIDAATNYCWCMPMICKSDALSVKEKLLCFVY